MEDRQPPERDEGIVGSEPLLRLTEEEMLKRPSACKEQWGRIDDGFVYADHYSKYQGAEIHPELLARVGLDAQVGIEASESEFLIGYLREVGCNVSCRRFLEISESLHEYFLNYCWMKAWEPEIADALRANLAGLQDLAGIPAAETLLVDPVAAGIFAGSNWVRHGWEGLDVLRQRGIGYLERASEAYEPIGVVEGTVRDAVQQSTSYDGGLAQVVNLALIFRNRDTRRRGIPDKGMEEFVANVKADGSDVASYKSIRRAIETSSRGIQPNFLEKTRLTCEALAKTLPDGVGGMSLFLLRSQHSSEWSLLHRKRNGLPPPNDRGQSGHLGPQIGHQ